MIPKLLFMLLNGSALALTAQNSLYLRNIATILVDSA